MRRGNLTSYASCHRLTSFPLLPPPFPIHFGVKTLTFSGDAFRTRWRDPPRTHVAIESGIPASTECPLLCLIFFCGSWWRSPCKRLTNQDAPRASALPGSRREEMPPRPLSVPTSFQSRNSSPGSSSPRRGSSSLRQLSPLTAWPPGR